MESFQNSRKLSGPLHPYGKTWHINSVQRQTWMEKCLKPAIFLFELLTYHYQTRVAIKLLSTKYCKRVKHVQMSRDKTNLLHTKEALNISQLTAGFISIQQIFTVAVSMSQSTCKFPFLETQHVSSSDCRLSKHCWTLCLILNSKLSGSDSLHTCTVAEHFVASHGDTNTKKTCSVYK